MVTFYVHTKIATELPLDAASDLVHVDEAVFGEYDLLVIETSNPDVLCGRLDNHPDVFSYDFS